MKTNNNDFKLYISKWINIMSYFIKRIERRFSQIRRIEDADLTV